MGFNCGIVGLPNVGKSTLFNALLQTQAAEAANYPFCTIEPNVGKVSVPDLRLLELAKIAGSKELIPEQLEFVDIAGLVRGASTGEGLGNKFLSHIREVDAIVYMLRCFEDGDITHVEGSIDPIRDAEIIEMELVLADLESLEKRIPAMQKKAKNDKEAAAQVELMERVLAVVAKGEPARNVEARDTADAKALRMLNLLTSKPVMYVCNVEEESAATGNALSQKAQARAAELGAKSVVVSARIESEIAMLSNEEEKKEFLDTLGLQEAGLAKVIRTGFELLDLISFFTIGPKEARAWTVRRGAKAPEAAGVIHTDFEKGFIRAETIATADYIAGRGEAGAREAGKLRLEGKEYVVQDGDVLHFRFNV